MSEDFLSAALEDAEGHALVNAIHDPNNPRLRNSHTLVDDNRKLFDISRRGAGPQRTRLGGYAVMAPTVRKYQRLPVTVDAAQYDSSPKSVAVILNWVVKHGGMAFPASELLFRHDMGTYWHPVHGFVYVPQGTRNAGSEITMLRDDELIVRTDTGIYALVFPGDYIVRSRSGFYPLAEESFDRSYQPNARRRGNTVPALSPAV